MNGWISLWGFMLIAAGLLAQDVELYRARRYGAMAKECLRVTDQDGRPIRDAKIWGGIKTGEGIDDFTPISGLTDTNGEFLIQGRCTDRIRCDITKDGYYPSELGLENYGYSHCVTNGVWYPFGVQRTIKMKRIMKPGRSRAFPNRLRNCRIPEYDRWIGFDLERSEWVSPYGRGKHSDVLLRFAAVKRGMHDYRYVMDVTFTNNPYAGAYLLEKDKTSKLETEYEANSNAIYQTSFSFMSEQIPGQPRHWDFLDRDSYLVFRTRTRVDEHGRLTGSHYGKILGRWLSGMESMILSDGCFNPVENDINIEDSTCLREVLRNLGNRQ